MWPTGLPPADYTIGCRCEPPRVTAETPWSSTHDSAHHPSAGRIVPMRVTQKVKKILDWYEGDPPGVKANIARILSTGKLGGTGKVVILPVDQGFEHGPARSFAPNPAAYDPHYHYQLAIEAG